MHATALIQLRNDPKIVTRAKESLQGEGGKVEEKRLQAAIDSVLNEITLNGKYKPAKIFDLFMIQIFWYPYYIIQYIYWYARWVHKFSINKEPYGIEERLYLTRTTLGYSKSRWESLEEEERVNLLEKDLYIPKNYAAYQKEQQEILRAKYGNKLKKYNRWKKHQ